MDLAQAFNAPEAIAFGGRAFAARALKLSEWAGVQAWLKAAVPSPVVVALAAIGQARELGYPLTPGVRDEVLTHAQEAARKWPPRVASKAWTAAIDSAEGGTERFVRAALEAAGNDLAGVDLAELVDRATQPEFDELLRVAYYGDPPAPKATGPAPAAGTTTTTTPATTATTGAPASPGSPPAAGPTPTSGP